MELRNKVIYQIRNIINNHRYIGSTVDFHKRELTHRRELNAQKHCNQILQRAWDKYGNENFIFEIIEECEKSKLIKLEQTYLTSLNPEYNISKSASGGDTMSQHPNKQNIYKNLSDLRKRQNKNNCERLKKLSKTLSISRRGENHPLFNKKRPEHSLFMKGQNNPMSKINRELRESQ